MLRKEFVNIILRALWWKKGLDECEDLLALAA
jgi:hypothetical protein